ncbi:LysR family transcriptional regulator [Veronia pacifica]|nr:LysR substrate-binding domain-containing protein [Veronia pacifica]
MNAFKVFAAVGRYQSIRLAAHELNISESAVSQHMKNLEERLQVTLIEKVGRNISLTKEGKRFYPFVVRGMSAFYEGVASLEEDQLKKDVTISLIPSMAKWLVNRLPDFIHANDGIRVSVKPTNVHTNEHDTDVDISLRFGIGQYPSMTSTPLLHDKIVIVTSPSLMIDEKRHLTPDFALSLPWLGYYAKDIEDINIAIQQFLNDENQTIATLAGGIEVHDPIVVLEAALSGQGVAVTRLTMASQYISTGQLVCLFEMPTFTAFQYFIVHPLKRPLSKEVERFAAWLRQCLHHDFPALILTE